MWRGVGSQPVLGQTILLVKSKPFDSRTEETEIPFPQYPVNVEVEYDRKILHDFYRNPFAGVRVRVEFSGQDGEKSGEGGILLQFCLQDVERGVRWTGVTGRNKIEFLSIICFKYSPQKSFYRILNKYIFLTIK